jgi:hypothetical protein
MKHVAAQMIVFILDVYCKEFTKWLYNSQILEALLLPCKDWFEADAWKILNVLNLPLYVSFSTSVYEDSHTNNP